jgi:phage-related protein
MADSQVSFTILGKDQASPALASVGSSAKKTGKDLDDNTGRVERFGEATDTAASRSSQLSGGIGDIGGALSLIPGPLGTVGMGLEIAGTAATGATGAFDLLNLSTQTTIKSFLLIGGTVLVIVAILAGLFFALKYAYNHSESFRTAVDKLWAAIKKAGATIRDALQPYIDKFSAWMAAKGTILINKLSVLITTKLIPAIGKIATWIATKLIPKLAQFVSWFNTRIMPTLSKVVGFIVTKLIPAWVRFQTGALSRVISGIRLFVRVIGGIIGAVSRAVSGVRTRFNSMVSFVRGIPGRVRGVFSGLWSGVGSSLRSALNSALSLPLTIPSISIGGMSVGGQTLIPRLANGGITTGPMLAQIGDNRSGREAIVPLERAGEMGFGGGDINIHVSAGVGDPVAIGRAVANALGAYVSAGGRVRVA